MLNPGQQLAYDTIIGMVGNKGQRLVVSGFGGTGKTYTVSQAIKFLAKEGWKVLVAAPTHDAKELLKEAICESAEFTTVASLCGHFGLETENGDTIFVGRGLRTAFLENFDLLVVEESSQISAKDAELLLSAELPVLFLGDHGQLPPVREQRSAIFEAGLPTIHLTQQMRNPGPIEQVALKARNSLYVPTEESGGVRISQDVAMDFITALSKAAAQGEPTCNYVFLAFTNARAREVAAMARQAIGGTTEYSEGDWIRVANRNMQIEAISPIRKYGFAGYIIQSSGQTFDVLSPSETERFFDHINLLKEEGQRCKEAGNSNGAKAYFGERKLLLNAWAQVSSANAMTVHKAQGQTFQHVWVDTNDIVKGCGMSLQTKSKMLYTGYSRAQKSLTVAQTRNKFKLGSGSVEATPVPPEYYETLLMEAVAHYPVKPLKPQSVKAFMRGGWVKYADNWQEAWINRLQEHKDFNESKGLQ